MGKLGTKIRCVAVINNSDTSHVGFVAGISATNKVILLGGNQGDSVRYSPFPKSDIEKYVYPVGYEPNYLVPTYKNFTTSSTSLLTH